jgi:serine protease Do
MAVNNDTNNSGSEEQLPPLQTAIRHYRRRQGGGMFPRALVFLVLILAIGFLGGWVGSKVENRHGGNTTVEQQKVVLSSEGDVISNIASTVGQSVVSVNVTGTTAGSNSSLDSLFGGGSTGQTEQSAGTGIILTKDGLIITNRHVVPVGTTNVSVTLSDGTTYNNVQIIGRTSSTDSLDIAFLKIPNTNGKTLVPAQIGDSTQTKVGDPVVAIGNALGQFQNTVTSGIISGYGRNLQASDSTGASSENLDDLFQTDAAINEGNSGGPLVNLDGQVIGINTALADSAQSIGFAIPINDVTGLIKSVESTGKLERPYLGIIYIPITADIQSQYNLSVSNGAYIPPASVAGQASIIAGGPAAKAGLQEGDIITQVDGTSINETNSLTSILDKETVGNTVSITVIRGGKTLNLNVTIGAAPTDN